VAKPGNHPNKLSDRAALLVLLFAAFGFWVSIGGDGDPSTSSIDSFTASRTGDVQPHPAPAPDGPLTFSIPESTRPATPAPRVEPTWWQGPTGAVEVAAGEVLFDLHPDVSERALRNDLERLGAVWIAEGAGSGRWRVAFGADVPVDEAASRARMVAGVRSISVNAIVRGASCGAGDLVGPLQWEAPDVGLPPVCPSDSVLDQVSIAILDTGVAYEDWSDASGDYVQASELAGVPFVFPKDFINLDDHANDDHQHGTHLASLIAARGRLRGYAPNPVLMPVKVLDDQMVGTEWSLVEGMHWAIDNGAEVINLSLTFSLNYAPSGALYEAMATADTQGVVVVAAGGNQNTNDRVAYPAAMPSVIAVSAARYEKDDENKISVYSNKGWALDLSSAGGDLNKDKTGDGVPDGLIGQTINPDDPTDVGYWVMAGTSQAAAVVSAQASWLLAEGTHPAEVRTALLVGSGAPKDTAEFTDESGFGFGSSAHFLAMLDGPGIPAIPEAFVNIVVGLEDEGAKTRGVAWVEAVDGTGQPLVGLTMYGRFAGADDTVVSQSTDSDGRARFETSAFPLDSDLDPILLLFSIEAVEVDLTGQLNADYQYAAGVERRFDKYPVVPGGFYRLSEGNASLVGGALDENPEGGVVFAIDAADGGAVCDWFDCGKLDLTYNARSLGGGFSSSTVNVTFNRTYLEAIGGAGFSSSTVNVNYGSPLWFPWGSSDAGEFELVDLDGSGFSSSTVNVMRWDPSLFGSGFSSSTVNVLAYDCKLFGSGFSSSTVNVLSLSSMSWGSGFSSSTVNVIRWDGTFSYGSGFSSSTVNLLGFNSRLYGNGFSSSTVNAFPWSGTIFGASAASVGASAEVVEPLAGYEAYVGAGGVPIAP